LEKVCDAVPKYDMKTILGDFKVVSSSWKRVVFISSMWRAQPSTTEQMTMEI
jgi:hypothetical protein